MSDETRKRIKEEFHEININLPSNIGVTVGLPDEDNIFLWQCSLMGPKDTSYRDGIFFIRIRFPDNYPDKRPEVVFKTPIYHLNINPIKSEYKSLEPLGYVAISSLENWKPDYTIRQVLCDIFALLYMPNPN